jgi:hypothetical protein
MTREEAAQRVIDAWTVEGSFPTYHRELKIAVRRRWPILAMAIEDLVHAERSP